MTRRRHIHYPSTTTSGDVPPTDAGGGAESPDVAPAPPLGAASGAHPNESAGAMPADTACAGRSVDRDPPGRPAPRSPFERATARREFCAHGVLPTEVDGMLDAMEEPGLRWHHRYAIARSVLSDKPHTVLRILQQCGYVPRSQEMP